MIISYLRSKLLLFLLRTQSLVQSALALAFPFPFALLLISLRICSSIHICSSISSALGTGNESVEPLWKRFMFVQAESGLSANVFNLLLPVLLEVPRRPNAFDLAEFSSLYEEPGDWITVESCTSKAGSSRDGGAQLYCTRFTGFRKCCAPIGEDSDEMDVSTKTLGRGIGENDSGSGNPRPRSNMRNDASSRVL